jgi:hypothetical protein
MGRTFDHTPLPMTTHIFPGIAKIEYSSVNVGEVLGPNSGYVALSSRWVANAYSLSLWLPMVTLAVPPLIALISATCGSRDRRLADRRGVTIPVAIAPRPRRTFCKVGSVLFTLAAVVSLAVMIALIAVWYDSYHPYRTFSRGPFPEDSLILTSMSGNLGGTRNKVRPAPGQREIYRDYYVFHLTCGVSTYTGPHYYSWSFRTPFWFPTGLAAILPAIWLMTRPGRRRRRRLLRGLCPRCGYDLRFTPSRCPECGMNIVARNKPEAEAASDAPGLSPAGNRPP